METSQRGGGGDAAIDLDSCREQFWFMIRSKLVRVVLLGTLVAAGLGSGCATAPEPKSSPAYEYKSITGLLAGQPGDEGRLDLRITKRTEEGWELVTVGHLSDNFGFALFRRPKP